MNRHLCNYFNYKLLTLISDCSDITFINTTNIKNFIFLFNCTINNFIPQSNYYNVTEYIQDLHNCSSINGYYIGEYNNYTTVSNVRQYCDKFDGKFSSLKFVNHNEIEISTQGNCCGKPSSVDSQLMIYFVPLVVFLSILLSSRKHKIKFDETNKTNYMYKFLLINMSYREYIFARVIIACITAIFSSLSMTLADVGECKGLVDYYNLILNSFTLMEVLMEVTTLSNLVGNIILKNSLLLTMAFLRSIVMGLSRVDVYFFATSIVVFSQSLAILYNHVRCLKLEEQIHYIDNFA